MGACALKGMSWNHSRGFVSAVATAQRFSEVNPDVDITWEKRSLQAFADAPLEELCQRFDLLVIDHPHVGQAARHGSLLALDALLDDEFLSDQQRCAVGQSFASYQTDDRLWALPIDAAAPVAAWRPDRLESLGEEVPKSYDQVLRLAKRGCVIVPGIPIDCLMNLYSMCLAAGDEPFTKPEHFISRGAGEQALLWLHELYAHSEPACWQSNPIAVFERLSQGHGPAYCPFAYGYVNYARAGYAEHRLRFGPPAQVAGKPLRTTLGGTGLAISANCKNPDKAAAYARFVAHPERQRGLYFDAGGQPGHRGAWTDAHTNRQSDGFFERTLATLDQAYLRPRYPGYLGFQDLAGAVVQAYLKRGGSTQPTLDELDALYRASLTDSL